MVVVSFVVVAQRFRFRREGGEEEVETSGTLCAKEKSSGRRAFSQWEKQEHRRGGLGKGGRGKSQYPRESGTSS